MIASEMDIDAYTLGQHPVGNLGGVCQQGEDGNGDQYLDAFGLQ